MRTFKGFVFALTLSLAFAAAALADSKAAASRAEEVLRQARAAIGGEEKIRAVQGIAAKGNFRRVIMERETSGERQLDFALPDKYMRSESWVLGGMGTTAYLTHALNGGESWSENSAGGGMVIRMNQNGERVKPTEEQLKQMEKARADRTRAEFARYLLALMLTPPQGYEVEFAYAGEAEAADGRADVIDATGAGGLNVRLFLDKQSHLPLMLTYRGPKTRTMMMQRPAGGGGHAEAVREAQDKAAKEMAGPPKPEEAEYQLRFEDYRAVGGLLLPHRITQAMDGETQEEWTVKSYELNPQFKPEKFQKKK